MSEVPWQRLDPRMLLVHPVRELGRFLPPLAGLFVAGAASDAVGLRWQLLGVLVPVGLGLARYLTTAYRVTEDRVELRRGLLERHLLSVPRERVRTVDLTASPVHRVLGLCSVRVGTGTASTSEEDQVDLDGLRTAPARALRHALLAAAVPGATDGVPDRPLGEPILRLDPRWAGYAPLTSTGLVLAGAGLAAGSQVAGELGLDPAVRVDDVSRLLWLVPAFTAAVVAVVAVLAVGGYLVSHWGFTLARGADGGWHLRRGLLTTRETSLDGARVAGVCVAEPAGLRLAGAARLSAVVTGLGNGLGGNGWGAGQQESSLLVPPAPREVVDAVATAVLGTSAPVRTPLRGHGPAATRRRWTRALLPAVPLAAALAPAAEAVGAWLLVPAGVVLGAACLLAADRARGLGHALVDGYLVARSGSLLRHREALATRDVIGWTFRDTWFQRRAGLTSLVATTAGGRQRVTLPDVPAPDAVTLACAALPGLVDEFRA